jgi:CheY-like chemotaxis protein/HPt (histidine-containing phosphotransfer) domain-containing protein
VTPEPVSSTSDSGGLHILIAEDCAESRELIHYYFQGTPHLVDTVSDGLRAVERYCAGRYDLVLMDLQMPGMDGFQATRSIRDWEAAQKRTAVPIIALTANAFGDAAEQSAAAGCTGILTKPITRALLLATVTRTAAPKSSEPTAPAACDRTGRHSLDVAQRIEQELRDRRPQFLHNRRKDLVALQAAAARGDYRTIGLLSHRMRGISASYGFPEVGKLGHELEVAANSADRPAVDTQLAKLASLLEECDEAA